MRYTIDVRTGQDETDGKWYVLVFVAGGDVPKDQDPHCVGPFDTQTEAKRAHDDVKKMMGDVVKRLAAN